MRIVKENKKGQKLVITIPTYDYSQVVVGAPAGGSGGGDAGGGGGPDSTLILDWDIQIANSYPGSGTTITDLQGNIDGNIVGVIDYTNGTPKYLMVEGGPSEYLVTKTGLNLSLIHI